MKDMLDLFKSLPTATQVAIVVGLTIVTCVLLWALAQE